MVFPVEINQLLLLKNALKFMEDICKNPLIIPA